MIYRYLYIYIPRRNPGKKYQNVSEISSRWRNLRPAATGLDLAAIWWSRAKITISVVNAIRIQEKLPNSWWFMMIYYPIRHLWWFMMIDDLWWFMIIYDDLWWSMMIYDDLWWFMMIYYPIQHLWWLMIYDDLCWFMMIYYPIRHLWWFMMIDDLCT